VRVFTPLRCPRAPRCAPTAPRPAPPPTPPPPPAPQRARTCWVDQNSERELLFMRRPPLLDNLAHGVLLRSSPCRATGWWFPTGRMRHFHFPTSPGTRPQPDALALLQAADERLYTGQAGGRNRSADNQRHGCLECLADRERMTKENAGTCPRPWRRRDSVRRGNPDPAGEP